MKSIYRRGIVCGCTILVGGVAGFALQFLLTPGALKGKLASELAPSDPTYNQVMCGPSSLAIALGRLGISRAAAEIASECRVTSSGVALTDLERVAGSLPTIRAVAKRLRWEDLRNLDGVAVLFVKGNHYLVVDPREVSSDTRRTDAFRVYDGRALARWYSLSELEKIWSGEALAITKQNDLADVQGGARIAWDECYVDKGYLPDASRASFLFSFRNLGDQDLVIGGIQKSCGCIEHRLSKTQLAPGESAQIEVDVALAGKEGFVQQRMVLATNDSLSPNSVLQMLCGVPRKLPVSSQAMRLEDLRQGGHANREFVVSDQRLSGIRIRDVTFVLRDGSLSSEDVSCLIDWTIVKDDADAVKRRTGFPAAPGDYLVRLSFEAGPACPPGPFAGDVIATVEADDSVAERKVEIQGAVVRDVQTVPRLALISLDLNGAGSETLRLESASGRRIAVAKAWSDADDLLAIVPDSAPRPDVSKFVIKVQGANVEPGAAPLNHTLFFRLENGLVVSLPVTVFKPPRPS